MKELRWSETKRCTEARCPGCRKWIPLDTQSGADIIVYNHPWRCPNCMKTIRREKRLREIEEAVLAGRSVIV